ncbi:MAG: hypothetical protein K2N10_05495 [Muribaculaceae bacterium]|nr:hypothetical protein [Muribaculaceae bacterium]
MKKAIIILASILSLSVPVRAEKKTTTIVGARSVCITENANGVRTLVDAINPIYMFNYKCVDATPMVVTRMSRSGVSLVGIPDIGPQSSVRWDLTCGGLGFGFCSALGAPSAAGIEMGKSFEISWFHIAAVEATNRFGNSFSLGIGLDWRNYRTTLGGGFMAPDGHVDVCAAEQLPEAVRLSRIKIFSLQLPLLYTQTLPFGITKSGFALSFGPIFNFNTHASVLTAWQTGSAMSEYKAEGINVRKFTIDLFASLSLCKGFRIYARYSPYKALTGRYPLNFRTLSTGVLFFM